MVRLRYIFLTTPTLLIRKPKININPVLLCAFCFILKILVFSAYSVVFLLPFL